MPISPRIRRTAALALGLALLLTPLDGPVRADESDAPSTRRVPILWEVQTEPTIYLFGTIHVADTRVTTHPEVVQRALANSQALYTELDFANMGGAAMLQHVLIPDGKSLADIASEETMGKLKKVLDTYEVPPMQAMQFQRIRPWLTAVQVPVLVNAKRKAEEAAKRAAEAAKAATEAGGTEPAAEPAQPDPMANMALDLRLYMTAKQAGKTVGGLEKPEEQFSIFNEITLEKQVQMLDESLDAILELDKPAGDGAASDGGEEQVDPIEMLIRMYVAGDVEGFHAMMKESMGDNQEMTAFMEKLLDRRNVVMVRRMLEAAQKHPDKTMFVAVGAGHYAGPMGIVKLLEQTGYRVRPLPSVEAMDAPWPKVGAARETSSRARPCPPRRCCPPRAPVGPRY